MNEEELKKEIEEIDCSKNKELCLNCHHSKRFHTQKGCSQPTCMCNCFINSGIYSNDNVWTLRTRLEGYEKAQSDFQRKIDEVLKYLGERADFLIDEEIYQGVKKIFSKEDNHTHPKEQDCLVVKNNSAPTDVCAKEKGEEDD